MLCIGHCGSRACGSRGEEDGLLSLAAQACETTPNILLELEADSFGAVGALSWRGQHVDVNLLACAAPTWVAAMSATLIAAGVAMRSLP